MSASLLPRSLSSWCFCCITLLVAALLVVTIGCPKAPLDGINGNGNGDTNGDGTTDGDTDGDGTTDGDTDGDGTTDGDTDGDGTTDGGDDVGGDDTPPPTTITLIPIVRTGAAVPGQPAGTTFTEFSSPVIDDDGRVAFWARHQNGNGGGGLYVWEPTTDDPNGILRVVVDDDPTDLGSVPGGAADDHFSLYADTFDDTITWGSAGRLLFEAWTTVGTGAFGLYRWRASDEDLIRVADAGMMMAALGLSPQNAVFIGYFGNLGVTDDGIVLFRTRYTYLATGGTSATGRLVCTSNGIEITPLYEYVPDQGSCPQCSWNDFKEEVTLSPDGYLIYQGQYGGAGAVGDHGVYLKLGDNPLARVVDNRPSSSLPGLPANARIGTAGEYYDRVAIGANNHIAVETEITVDGATRDAVILWDWNVNRWTELTSPDGDQATTLLSGVSDGGAVVVLAAGTPHVVDRRRGVSIAADLPPELDGVNIEWGRSNGAINNLGHAIVPYTRTDGGTPGLGFWTADGLLVLADPVAELPTSTVADILASSIPENDRPGRSGILNDHDEAVFLVTVTGADGVAGTADDRQGMYVGRAE